MFKSWTHAAILLIMSALSLTFLNKGNDILYSQYHTAETTKPCTLQELGVGSWNRNVMRRAPYCCLAANSQQKNCQANPNLPSDQRRNQGCGSGCYCDMDAQYSPLWVPFSQCHLDAWDSSLFCARLGRRRLVFVGDSLAGQFHAATFGMLHEEKRNLSDTCVDQLVFRDTDTFHFFSYDRGQSLESIVAEEKAIAAQLTQELVFVVCIGPHLTHSMKPPLESQLVGNYTTLIRFAQSLFDMEQVKFRFIPPTPVHSCNVRRNITTIELLNVTGRFHYPHIPAMKRELYRVLGSELVLPTFDALDQRPEAHTWKDCLHYCLPGALQIVPIFLSHLMLIGKL